MNIQDSNNEEPPVEFIQPGQTIVNQTSGDQSLESIILINNNIRADLLLSLAIYKKLNNFEHNYINNVPNVKKKNSK
jgi:hypothetical protein